MCIAAVHESTTLGVFHCGAQNFDAIGGTADIDWPPAPIASEAYDPLQSLAGQICCDAQYSPSRYDTLSRAKARQ
jgi:hypothetical protein